MDADWIAETTFDCVPPKGRRFTLKVRIGRAVVIPREGQMVAYARCPVALDPLSGEHWIAGEDTFQALCLGVEFVRKVLKAFANEGGRVLFRNSRSPIDLDDPSFLPLSTLAELTAGGKRTGRKRSTERGA